MTKLELIEKLSTLPELIAEQEIDVINANLQVLASKGILTEAEDVLILSGAIDGKNAETRNAQLRAKTAKEREAIQDAENDLSVARVELNRLNNELSVCRAIAGMLKGVE